MPSGLGAGWAGLHSGVLRHLSVQDGQNFAKIRHLFGRMMVQAAGEVLGDIFVPQMARGLWRDRVIRVAAFDMAQEKARPHFAALWRVAHEMGLSPRLTG